MRAASPYHVAPLNAHGFSAATVAINPNAALAKSSCALAFGLWSITSRPPGHGAVLADALRRAIADPDLRARLAEAAWEAAQNLPRWPETARRIAGVLRDVAR